MTRVKQPVCILLALILLLLSLLTGCGGAADGDGMVNTQPTVKPLLLVCPYEDSEEYSALGEADSVIDTQAFMGEQDKHIRFKALVDDVRVSIYRVMYFEGFLGFCRFYPESDYSVTVKQGEVCEFAAYFPEYGYDYCLVAELGELRAEWLISEYSAEGENSIELVGRKWAPQPVSEDSPMIALCEAHAITACTHDSLPGYLEKPWYFWNTIALAMDLQLHYYGADGVQEVEEWIVSDYIAALFPHYCEYTEIPEGVGEYIQGNYAPYIVYPAMDDETRTKVTDIRQNDENGTTLVTVEVKLASGDRGIYDIELKANAARNADSPFEYGIVSVAVQGGETLYSAPLTGDSDIDAAAEPAATPATKPTGTPKPSNAPFLPELTPAQTCAMSNMMNNSWFVRDDNNSLCGRAFAGDTISFVRDPYLMADATIIEYECAPYALSIYEGDFYYIDAVLDRYALYRHSNGEAEWLIGDVESYTIWDGVIYYTQNTDFYLRSYRLSDGQEGVVLNKEVFFPYAVDGWIVYQDDADGERIHAYNLSDDRDITLTDEQSYCPIIEGNTLWYLSGAENRICTIDLETGKRTQSDAYTTQNFYLTQTNLYYYNSNEEADEIDDLPMSVPRENGKLNINEEHMIPGDDNFQFFRFAEVYYYVAVDYTNDMNYYVESFNGFNDYYDGDIVSWLDISVG